MQPLGPSEILNLLDRGTGMSAARRGVAILAAATPELTWEDVAAVPLGARDRALLAQRAWIAGPDLSALESCPACKADVEVSFRAEEIGLGGSPTLEPARTTTVELGGRSLRLRPVTTADMIAAESARTPEHAREILLSRVVDGAETLDPEVIDSIEEALEELDPAAHVELRLACPECGEETVRAFDASSFVWTELADQARRLLREVAELARIYHWSEADILAMTPTRRHFYLEAGRA